MQISHFEAFLKWIKFYYSIYVSLQFSKLKDKTNECEHFY